jgi:uroporphyrin-III C-methyltransferase / precorrin-2 dehydrogenase / sirohydrochlorin ferrochelatase
MSPIEPLDSLPVFFSLRDRVALLAGSGEGVVWKLELIAAAGARVRLRAPSPLPELVAAAARLDRVELLDRRWREEDFEGAALAILDAENDDEAEAFHAAGRRAGTPVNVIDRPDFCDFSFGAIVNRSPLVVAISTDGAAPVFAQALRARVEAILPPALKSWAQAARDWRQRIQPLGWDLGRRRGFWERFAALALGAGEKGPSDADFAALAAARNHAAPRGRLTLVGAGPGDPELLTIKAVRALQGADVILHDSLASAGALELARREAQRIDVGKRAGRVSPRQAEVTARAVALALQGKRVVRLKGGDPGVFGRASEEIAAARAAGVEIEIVPGVTTALAAAAELGVSLTDRDLAPRLQFATIGDIEGGAPEDFWRALADRKATTALYMSGRKLGQIVERLIAEGLDPATPAVFLENVSRPDARRVAARIEALSAAVGTHGGEAPALVLYGLVFEEAMS